MPTNVVTTPTDEKHWEKAKQIAADQGLKDDYAYIMGIFKKMSGIKEEKFLSFEDWLIESKELDNDSRGKLHELLTAAHLNRLIHGKLAHAEHFRDEKGRTPHEVHDAIAKDLDNDTYQKAHHHAVQAAEHIHDFLRKNHPEVLNKDHNVKVSWTSLKSDHEKLTGKKDEAHSGGADIMVSSHDKDSGETHHAVGLSMKIADNKITTGQTGSKTTEQILGMKPGSLQQHDENHRKDVSEILKKYGYDGDKMSEAQKHAAFKESRDSDTPAGKKMADEIRASSYKHAAKKVEEMKNHLNSQSLDDQKSRLSEFVAPTHTFPTYQVATSPKSDKTVVKNEHEEVGGKIKGAKELHYFQSEGNGNSMIVKDHTGKTLHRIEVRSKRPVGHSEIMVK